MIKQILLPLLGVIIFVILVGVFTQKSGKIDLSKYLPTPTPQPSKMITINNRNIFVEIANTESLREKGLGGRKSLNNNAGMLFVFDVRPVTPTFWMKDMLIPLDIIWIADGEIIKINKNVPSPAIGTPDNKLALYSPGRPIDYVLEINAGSSDKYNFKVGQTLSGL